MFELIKKIFIGLLTDLDNRSNHTNKAKTLTEHISCECKCRFDGRRCNSGQGEIMINVDVSVENVMCVRKIMFGTFLHVIVKMENI